MKQREIKFRAWDKKRRIIDYDLSFLNGSFLTDDYKFDDGCGERVSMGDDLVVMQYTGLKDKNGKEIYEGDIVDTKEDMFPNKEVKFMQGVFGVVYPNGVHYPLRQFCKTRSSKLVINIDFEIIGNIYENNKLDTENE